MNNHKYAFAIVGYNNEIGIKRLLSSLDKVIIPDGDILTLIFCLDKSKNNNIKNIADKYEWKHGQKIVFQHQNRVGLKENILYCGNMMNIYDLDAMAVFEDDIYMSPVVYQYMVEALNFYSNDERIAGISLYKHEININAKHPFIDYNDGGDTFFVQYAMSWGQIWMRESWNQFYKWYKDEKYNQLDFRFVPQNILTWDKSWLKYHIMYCIAQDKYFVYPRISITTDFADPGEHNKEINTSMQVPINWGGTNWKFNSFENTKSIYDSFFENVSLEGFLKLNDLEVDLYGIKNIRPGKKYALTRKELSYKIIKTWGLRLRPIEANIFMDISGNELFLYDLSVSATKERNSKKAYIEYDIKGLNITSSSMVVFFITVILKKSIYKIRNLFSR